MLLAEVPSVEGLDVYFERSRATLVDVPAGRWEAVDETLRQTNVTRLHSGNEMLRLELQGGMAMRRGDLRAAEAPLSELRHLALASGEPQRILPMASVVLPYAALTGDGQTIRDVGEDVLANPSPPRADRTPRLEVSTAVSEGLAALASGRPSEAVDRLQIASERESELGWSYRAACLQLDLASALEAAGKGTEAASARAAADAVLEPLRCVHPY